MAPPSRRPGPPVAEALVDDAHRFDFYEAVRLLEQLYPDRAPVGEGLTPAAEPVRFRAHDELGFPASDVVAVEPRAGDPPADMSVSFMPLAGAHGPLPAPYTELIQERSRAGDTALRDFLDLLVHRLVALQYRSRRRHHVGLESGPPDQSTVARYLRAVGGLGPDAAHDRLSVPDQALLRYSALLGQRPPSAHGLSTLLDDYFGAEIDVRPLTGGWVPLAPHQRTRLGTAGQNQGLGTSAVLGRRAWDQQSRLRVNVHAPTYDDYLDFFPGGERHRALVDLSELYLERNVEVDIGLGLDADQARTPPLSSLVGPRLGRDAWAGRPQGDTVQTTVQPDTFAPALETLRIPLFAALSPGPLREVLTQLPEREVGADQHVVRQGRPADAFYVVAEGAADVRYQSPESDEPTVLTSLEPGGVFGDEALIEGGTYDGSLVTTHPSRLLVVSEDRLAGLVRRYPAVERAFERQYLSDADGAEEAAPTDAPALPTEGLLGLLAPPERRRLVRSGTVTTVDTGDLVLESGTPAPPLVLLLAGGPLLRGAGRPVETPGHPLNLDVVATGRAQPSALPAVGPARVLTVPPDGLRRLVRKHPPIERALRTWWTRHAPAER